MTHSKLEKCLLVMVLLYLCLHKTDSRKNVLLIMMDDLRPELGCYYTPGSQFHPNMHTPNIDALARKSMLFKEAYVQYPLCGPSRTSIFTSRRPDKTRVYSNGIYWRNTGGNFTTFPQYFKQNGYNVLGVGKMLPKGLGIQQDPQSWSRPVYVPKAEFIKGTKSKTWTAVNDTAELLDMLVANTAKDFMTELIEETPSKPFFLGVGFYKPHLPWVFPERYLQFYPEGDINLPVNPDPPKNMPDVAWTGHAAVLSHKYRDIAVLNYTGEKYDSRLPDDITKQLRRSYCTSVSYIDDLIGDVLKHLDATGQANNTIIAFFSDHGWHLGENSRWGKATSFQLNARAPLMLHIPGITDNGGVTDAKVEFVDIFPTLLEAAEIPPIQKCPYNSYDIDLCSDGESFMPLIKQPDLSWKEAVFWQVRGKQNTMGYTVFTGTYRYTIWTDTMEGPVKISNDAILAEELYNHVKDPYETFNIASGEKYKIKRRNLLSRLRGLLKDAFNKGIFSNPYKCLNVSMSTK